MHDRLFSSAGGKGAKSGGKTQGGNGGGKSWSSAGDAGSRGSKRPADWQGGANAKRAKVSRTAALGFFLYLALFDVCVGQADGKSGTDRKCFLCKEYGHFARDCPNPKGKGKGKGAKK